MINDDIAKALNEEGTLRSLHVVSLEPRRRVVGGITIWPYRQFLDALWNGEIGAGSG
jgi:hypothetical protein